MKNRTIRCVQLVLFVFPALISAQEKANKVQPLPNAHAHNDYEHQRPLLDALRHGFCSVEADVFLVDGEIVVAHHKFFLDRKRTLRKLYLEPLKERVGKNNGKVFVDGPVFTLLVDIKENGNLVYPVLKDLLAEYQDMLSGIRDGKYQQKAIQVVISGNCPRKLISADQSRLVSIDGRLGDLQSDAPWHLIPMISAHWGSNFKWRGRKLMPPQEVEKLVDVVSKAHAKQRRVRFWGSPESESVWQQQLSSGVDHLNTDQLDRMQKFLHAKESKN